MICPRLLHACPALMQVCPRLPLALPQEGRIRADKVETDPALARQLVVSSLSAKSERGQVSHLCRITTRCIKQTIIMVCCASHQPMFHVLEMGFHD